MDHKDLQKFRSECLTSHNYYRSLHRTAPLTWNSGLADSAQSWAEQLARSDSLKHSNEKGIGENIACFWGSELTGAKVTQIWYEENQHFDYESLCITSRSRPFCQVIWQDTRQLGAGKAKTIHGKEVIVARYKPAVTREHVAKNVQRPVTEPNLAPEMSSQAHRSPRLLGLRKFQEECLLAHNEYRFRHGAPPLRWSFELSWEAQQWAEELAQQGELKHNLDDSVGENLAGMLGDQLGGREATDMWYNEIEDYDFDSPGYGEDTSNFTQVVWVASENFGVGRAIEGDLSVVVAFYDPPGNIEECFDENVLKIGSMKKLTRRRQKISGFSPPLPDLEMFRIECLVTHNFYRARHGSPPLILTSTLTNEAQYWAERLLVTGTTEDLENSRIGISVAFLEWKHVSGITLSEMWYSQIFNYNFDSPGFNPETKNFTQLVWSSSRRVGIGKADDGNGFTVVVARYEPVGNIDGLFVPNVRRRGFERASCEPTQLNSDVPYKARVTSKSPSSFLSWENEGTQVIGMEPQVTRSSFQDWTETELCPRTSANFLLNRLLEDLDATQALCIDLLSPDRELPANWSSPSLSLASGLTMSDIDENSNVVSKIREEVKRQSSTDQFTQLVWIDGTESPRVEEPPVCLEQTNKGSMVYVTEQFPVDDEEEEEEEPAEVDVHEALVYSEPEVELNPRDVQCPRPQSICSDIAEIKAGSVLSKISFWEQVSQEGSRSSKVYDDDAEILTPELTSEGDFTEDEEDYVDDYQPIETIPEVEEQELEYDDVFPAHAEETESYSPVEFDDHYDDQHFAETRRQDLEAFEDEETYDECVDRSHVIYVHPVREAPEASTGSPDERLGEPEDIFSSEMEDILEHEESNKVEEDNRDVFSEVMEGVLELEETDSVESTEKTEKIFKTAPAERLETELATRPISPDKDGPTSDYFVEKHYDRQEELENQMTHLGTFFGFVCLKREPEAMKQLLDKEFPSTETEYEIALFAEHYTSSTQQQQQQQQQRYTGPTCVEEDVTLEYQQRQLEAVNLEELFAKLQQEEKPAKQIEQKSEEVQVPSDLCVFETLDRGKIKDTYFEEISRRLELVPVRTEEPTLRAEPLELEIFDDLSPSRVQRSEVKGPVCDENIEASVKTDVEAELDFDTLIAKLENEDTVNVEIDSKLQSDAEIKKQLSEDISDEELVEYGEFANFEQELYRDKEVFEVSKNHEKRKPAPPISVSDEELVEYGDSETEEELDDVFTEQIPAEQTTFQTTTETKVIETRREIHKREKITVVRQVYKSETKGGRTETTETVTETITKPAETEKTITSNNCKEREEVIEIEDVALQAPLLHVTEELSSTDSLEQVTEEEVEDKVDFAETTKDDPVYMSEFRVREAYSPVQIAGEIDTFSGEFEELVEGASFDSEEVKYYPREEEVSTLEKTPEKPQSPVFIAGDAHAYRTRGDSVVSAASYELYDAQYYPEDEQITVKQLSETEESSAYLVQDLIDQDVEEQPLEQSSDDEQVIKSFQEHQAATINEEIREMRPPLQMIRSIEQTDPFDGIQQPDEEEVSNATDFAESYEEFAEGYADMRIMSDEVRKRPLSLVHIAAEVLEKQIDMEVQQELVGSEKAQEYRSVEDIEVFVQKEEKLVSLVNMAGEFSESEHCEEVEEVEYAPVDAETVISFDKTSENFVQPSVISASNVAGVIDKRLTVYDSSELETDEKPDYAQSFEEDDLQEREKFVNEMFQPTNVAVVVKKRRTIYQELDIDSAGQSESALTYEENEFQEKEKDVGESRETLTNIAAEVDKGRTIYEEYGVDSLEESESAVKFEEHQFQEQERAVNETEGILLNVSAVQENNTAIYDEFIMESIEQVESTVTFEEDDYEEQENNVHDNEDKPTTVAAVVEKCRTIYDEYDTESPGQPESALYFAEEEFRDLNKHLEEVEEIPFSVAAVLKHRQRNYEEFGVDIAEQPESVVFYEENKLKEQEDFDEESPEQQESARCYEEDEFQVEEQCVDENEDKLANVAAEVEKRRTIYEDFDEESAEQQESARCYEEDEFHVQEQCVDENEDKPTNVAADVEKRRTIYEDMDEESAEQQESARCYEEDEFQVREQCVDENEDKQTNVAAEIEKRSTIYEDFDEESAEQQESARCYEEDEFHVQEQCVDENEDKLTNVAAEVEKRRAIYDELDTESPEQPESVFSFVEEEIQENEETVEETEEMPTNVVAVFEQCRTSFEEFHVESAEQPESAVFYEEDELNEQENSVVGANNISANVAAVVENRSIVCKQFDVQSAQQAESAVTFEVDDVQEQERSIYDSTDTSINVAAVVEKSRTYDEEFVDEIADLPETAESVEENKFETYEYIAKEPNESNVHIAASVEKRKTLYEEAELSQNEERHLGQLHEENKTIKSSKELNEQTTVLLHISAVVEKHNHIVETSDEEQRITHDVQTFEEARVVEQEAISEVCNSPSCVGNEFEAKNFTETKAIEDDYEQLSTQEIEDDDVIEEVMKLDICNSPVHLASEFEETFEDKPARSELENINVDQIDEDEEEEATTIEINTNDVCQSPIHTVSELEHRSELQKRIQVEEELEEISNVIRYSEQRFLTSDVSTEVCIGSPVHMAAELDEPEELLEDIETEPEDEQSEKEYYECYGSNVILSRTEIVHELDENCRQVVVEEVNQEIDGLNLSEEDLEGIASTESALFDEKSSSALYEEEVEIQFVKEPERFELENDAENVEICPIESAADPTDVLFVEGVAELKEHAESDIFEEEIEIQIPEELTIQDVAEEEKIAVGNLVFEEEIEIERVQSKEPDNVPKGFMLLEGISAVKEYEGDKEVQVFTEEVQVLKLKQPKERILAEQDDKTRVFEEEIEVGKVHIVELEQYSSLELVDQDDDLVDDVFEEEVEVEHFQQSDQHSPVTLTEIENTEIRRQVFEEEIEVQRVDQQEKPDIPVIVGTQPETENLNWSREQEPVLASQHLFEEEIEIRSVPSELSQLHHNVIVGENIPEKTEIIKIQETCSEQQVKHEIRQDVKTEILVVKHNGHIYADEAFRFNEGQTAVEARLIENSQPENLYEEEVELHRVDREFSIEKDEMELFEEEIEVPGYEKLFQDEPRKIIHLYNDESETELEPAVSEQLSEECESEERDPSDVSEDEVQEMKKNFEECKVFIECSKVDSTSTEYEEPYEFTPVSPPPVPTAFEEVCESEPEDTDEESIETLTRFEEYDKPTDVELHSPVMPHTLVVEDETQSVQAGEVNEMFEKQSRNFDEPTKYCDESTSTEEKDITLEKYENSETLILLEPFEPEAEIFEYVESVEDAEVARTDNVECQREDEEVSNMADAKSGGFETPHKTDSKNEADTTTLQTCEKEASSYKIEEEQKTEEEKNKTVITHELIQLSPGYTSETVTSSMSKTETIISATSTRKMSSSSSTVVSSQFISQAFSSSGASPVQPFPSHEDPQQTTTSSSLLQQSFVSSYSKSETIMSSTTKKETTVSFETQQYSSAETSAACFTSQKETLALEEGTNAQEKEETTEKDDGSFLEEEATSSGPSESPELRIYEKDRKTTARYYVDYSPGGSFEQDSEGQSEEGDEYEHVYIQQGEPLEEDLEEFILVRYSDDYTSSEEDTSDHREIYVIPEETSELEEEPHEGTPKVTIEHVQSYEEEHEEEAGKFEKDQELEDVQEEDEEEDERSREEVELKEYERLESLVILEDKLSHMESDEENNEEEIFGKMEPAPPISKSSSEETLQEDKFGETMTDSTLYSMIESEQKITQETTESNPQTKALPPRAMTEEDDEDEEGRKTDEEAQHESEEQSEVNQHLLQGMAEGQEPSVTDEATPEVGQNNSTRSQASSEEEEEQKEQQPRSGVLSCATTKESSDWSPILTKRMKASQSFEDSYSSRSEGEQSFCNETSSPSTPSEDEDMNEFQRQCFRVHNKYRRQHGVIPLTWSPELAADAEKWAKHLATAGYQEHCGRKDVGENLINVKGEDLTGDKTADLWYGEVRDYSFESPAYDARCGNFTQMIWAGTRAFGVARRTSSDGTHYVVARYRPPGNVLGEFRENVKPGDVEALIACRRRSNSGERPRKISRRRRSSRSRSNPDILQEREKFKKECLITHNYYRSLHDAPPMNWSPLLAAEAQSWADRLARTDSFKHSGDRDRGENLAFVWGSELTPMKATEMWYDEVKDYDFSSPGFTSNTGHFSQVVWVGTKQFGMGKAVGEDGTQIMVGRYHPPGNIVGTFHENVKPNKFGTK